jgi:hypothetical protein
LVTLISVGPGGGMVPCAACALAGLRVDESAAWECQRNRPAESEQGSKEFGLCFRIGRPTVRLAQTNDPESVESRKRISLSGAALTVQAVK